MAIIKVKVSQLSEAQSLENLWVLGVDHENKSVRTSMSLLRGNTAFYEWQLKNPGKTYDDWIRMLQDPALKAAEVAREAADKADETNNRVTAAENKRVTAEQNRAAEEGKRISAETGRVNAESERNQSEQNRTVAEQNRAAEEVKRVSAESSRNIAENKRESAESTRITAEQGRAAAEGKRVTAETARVTTEDNRSAAESARASAESARVTAEGKRVTAEQDRATEEGKRSSAETARANAEDKRITAETGRTTAEQGRVTAEGKRVTAESARQTASETAVKNADNAATAANTAATNANAAAKDTKELNQNPPKIQNGTWWVYNVATHAYVDTNQVSRGPEGKPLTVLSNGNYAYWDDKTNTYKDSGIKAAATVDLQNVPVTFTQAGARATINSGETVPTVFGKLKKWFADLGALAWKSKVNYNTDIDNVPAAIKNPSALTVSLNGTSQGAYDGSAAKSINITAGNVGAVGKQETVGGDSYINTNVFSWRVASPGAVGTIKINLPKTWSSTMLSFEIDFYQYNTNGTAKLIISGYNYTSPGWVNTSAQVFGKFPYNVRLGYDSKAGRCCILLGATNSSFPYPELSIVRVTSRYSNTTGWNTGYSVEQITSESSITHIVTPSKVDYNTFATTANSVRRYVLANTADAKTNYYLLGQAYTDTLINRTSLVGTLIFVRGAAGAMCVVNNIAISVNCSYNTNKAALTNISNGGYTVDVVLLTYNSVRYVALRVHQSSGSNLITFNGEYTKNGNNADFQRLVDGVDSVSNVAVISNNNIIANASSATQLQNARSLWGQSFNGTGNVTGTWYYNGTSGTSSNTHINGGGMELYHATPFIDFHFGNSTADYTSRLIENASGRLSILSNTTPKLSIGYANDSYNLAVGSMISNSWLRTNGQAGWYSQSYGGGIYMTDASFVRIYNNKKFQIDSVDLDSLKLAGGITTSKANPGSWISGMTSALLNLTGVQTQSSYHPYIRVKNHLGHVVNVGGLGNQFGFYGYYNGRTVNGTDWQSFVDMSSGNWTHSKNLTAGNLIKAGSNNNYVLLGGGGHKAVSDFAPKLIHKTATLTTTGWAGSGPYTYKITDSAVVDNTFVEIWPAAASRNAASEADIYEDVTVVPGSITITASNKPTVNINIKYKIQ